MVPAATVAASSVQFIPTSHALSAIVVTAVETDETLVESVLLLASGAPVSTPLYEPATMCRLFDTAPLRVTTTSPEVTPAL